MVIGHDPNILSEVSSEKNRRKVDYNPAPRLDRFAAGVVDSTIVVMLAKVFASQSIYSLRVSVSFDLENAILASLFNIFWLTFAVFLIYKVATYRIFKRTLGEIFFSIQTVSVLNAKSLDQYTFVLRTSLSYASVFFLYPVLSIFLNRDGRTFYDKICETVVVTNKPDTRRLNFYAPYDKLAGSLMIIFTFICFSYSSLYLSQNVFKFKSDFAGNAQVCSYIGDFHQAWTDNKLTESRLEVALALYSAEELSASCLKKEIDFELNVNPKSSTAYFAKGLLSFDDKNKFLKYFIKTCELDPRSTGCHVASWMTFWPNPYEGENKVEMDQLPVFGKIWLIKRHFKKGNMQALAKALGEMPVPKGLEGFYAEHLMRVEYFQGHANQFGEVIKLAENRSQNPRNLTEAVCSIAVSESCEAYNALPMCHKLTLARSSDSHLQNMHYACEGNSRNIFSSSQKHEDYYMRLAKKEHFNLDNLKSIFLDSSHSFNVRYATLNTFFRNALDTDYLQKVKSDWEAAESKDFIWRLAGENLKDSFKDHGDPQNSFYVYKKLSSEFSEIEPRDDLLNYVKESIRYPAQASPEKNIKPKGK